MCSLVFILFCFGMNYAYSFIFAQRLTSDSRKAQHARAKTELKTRAITRCGKPPVSRALNAATAMYTLERIHIAKATHVAIPFHNENKYANTAFVLRQHLAAMRVKRKLKCGLSYSAYLVSIAK
jgi:2-succinyl-5-enolpyruvyl-6-hydroxy-3-cyclohexene-1-carboxylate synthase